MMAKQPSQIEAEDADLALLAAACSPALRAGGEPGFQSTEEPRRALRRAAMRYGAAVVTLNAEATASEIAEFGSFAADEMTQGVRAAIIAARRRAVGNRLSSTMRAGCERVLDGCEDLIQKQASGSTDDLSPHESRLLGALALTQTLALMVEDAAMGTILGEVVDATVCVVQSARCRARAEVALAKTTAALTRSKDWVVKERVAR